MRAISNGCLANKEKLAEYLDLNSEDYVTCWIKLTKIITLTITIKAVDLRS